MVVVSSYFFVAYIIGIFYKLSGKPFLGSVIAGCFYNSILSVLALFLCQSILVKFADRKLASTATRCGIVFYLSLCLLFALYYYFTDRLNTNVISYIPTLVLMTPWIIAAFKSHRFVFSFSQLTVIKECVSLLKVLSSR
ncbi:hypothetical protein MAH1_35580 [Sessilibacter sp. MAH1]